LGIGNNINSKIHEFKNWQHLETTRPRGYTCYLLLVSYYLLLIKPGLFA
jgi:hypothetical protein